MHKMAPAIRPKPTTGAEDMVPVRSGNPAALVAQGDRRPAALRHALSGALPLSAIENRSDK